MQRDVKQRGRCAAALCPRWENLRQACAADSVHASQVAEFAAIALPSTLAPVHLAQVVLFSLQTSSAATPVPAAAAPANSTTDRRMRGHRSPRFAELHLVSRPSSRCKICKRMSLAQR
jgi:hypothetical protein